LQPTSTAAIGIMRFLRPTYAAVSKGSCSGASFALEPRCRLGNGIGELFVGDLPKVFRQVMVVIGYVGVVFCGGMGVGFLKHICQSGLAANFCRLAGRKSLPFPEADKEDSGQLCTLRAVDADTTDRGSGRENVE
jgi:hypothetical protein